MTIFNEQLLQILNRTQKGKQYLLIQKFIYEDSKTSQEVDEEKEVNEEACGASVASVASALEERRRRPDLLEERLGRQFAEFRRRRARRDHLREADEPAAFASPPASPGSQSAPVAPGAAPGPQLATRAASEPRPEAEPSWSYLESNYVED